MNKIEAPSLLISASSLRSGSTWVQRIAHAATDIFVWGEPFPLVESLSYIFRRYQEHEKVRVQETNNLLSRSQDPTVWMANANPPLDSLKRGFVALFSEYYRETYGRARYGWKEVRYGRTELEFLWNLFPALRVVLLVRNPIDVIRSLRGLNWIGRGEDTQSVSWVCQHWSRCTQDYLLLRNHPNILFLRYEDVASSVNELLAFIGGEFNEQVRQALNTVVGSASRLPPLSSEDLSTIIEICSNEMEMLGYLGVDQASTLQASEKQAQSNTLFRKGVKSKRENEYSTSPPSMKVGAATAGFVQMAPQEEAVQGIASHTTQLKKKVAALEAQVVDKERTIRVLSEQIAVKDAQIERITSTLGWRLLSYYGPIKQRYLLPIYRLLGLMPAERKESRRREGQGNSVGVGGLDKRSKQGDVYESLPLLPVPGHGELSILLDNHPLSSHIRRADVICFSIIDWEFRYQRPQQIMSQFAGHGHRVFYISISRFLPPKDIAHASAETIKENVYEVRLAVKRLPHIYWEIIEDNDQETILASLEELRRTYHISEAIGYVMIASWGKVALAARERWGWQVIFDCMDEWSSFPNIKPAVIDMEAHLVKQCDLLVVTAQRLFEKWLKLDRPMVLARNAVDYKFYAERYHPNSLLAEVRRPIIGYYGAIAGWFDIDLIAYSALQRPDYTFVLLGGIFSVDVSGLMAMPNVQLLGQQPYETMPEYLYHFNVCIIPFKINSTTKATDPVKLYEYLSGGKPVVSVDLPELDYCREYIYIAKDKEDFVAKLDEAVAENDPEMVVHRKAFAQQHTWEERYKQIQAGLTATVSRASIIIVTYNNLVLTKLCLESIIRNTDYPNYEVIIVDNDSTDGTQAYLQYMVNKYHNFAMILNPQNNGFPKATNQGLAQATGDYLILLNNDTIVTHGWLSRLLRHLEDPAVGMVGPVTNFVGNEAKIDVPYRTWAEMEAFAVDHTWKHEGQAADIYMLAMYCVALRREVYDAVGPLDEQFGIGMFEDDDYAQRMKMKGYRVICAADAFVHHFGQAAFRDLIKRGEYNRLFEENRRHFESKWNTKWIPHEHNPLQFEQHIHT